jgi:hypothetical protein
LHVKTKTLDAVELKRRGAERIQAQIAAMTQAQQIAFWQQRTLALQARQQERKEKQIRAIEVP